MNPKLRASYSVLDSWSKGRYEECTMFYFKLRSFTSIQMADGKDYHELWRKHVLKTKTLPHEFGSRPLVDPKVELKLEVSLGDWIDLVGVIDLYDDGIIADYKTGKKNSSEYVETMQLPVYGLLAKLSDMKVNVGKIFHYDQYEKRSDQSMLWLTKKTSKEALEWVKTNGAQMHEYFLNEGLYEKFGNRVPTRIDEEVEEA